MSTPAIAPTTGATTRNASCQNWLATCSEIRWRYASRPSRNPVVPKIAAKTRRRTAVATPRPGSGEERTTDIVRYEPAALGEAQVGGVGGEHPRRDEIVDHDPVSFVDIDAVPFAERRQVDSFGSPQREHDRLARPRRPFELLALAGDWLAGERRLAVDRKVSGAGRADAVEVGRRPDPEAQIRLIRPVERVVLRAEPGFGPVRDLV